MVMYDGFGYFIWRLYLTYLLIPHHYHIIQSLRESIRHHCHKKWSSRRMLWKWIKHYNRIELLWNFRLWWLFTQWNDRSKKIRHLCWTLYCLSRIRLLLLTRIINQIRSLRTRNHSYWWNLSRKINLPHLI